MGSSLFFLPLVSIYLVRESKESRVDTSQDGGPVEFVQDVLREAPYDKQTAIMRAVARKRRVSVVGCNASGKDWAAARIVLWWLYSHSPAKAIVTGPTSRQVDVIVWNEIRSAYTGAQDRITGRMFRTSRFEVDDQTFALGFATNSPYNLQGFHSPNLLAVITEAHAVDKDDIDAIRRLNPSRLLMMGNPLVGAGEFYDSHHIRRELYETVQISAFDTPNVREDRVVIPGMITRQDIADRRAEWGEKSALYVGSVLAEFPDNLDTVVVPLSAATDAAKRNLAPEGRLFWAAMSPDTVTTKRSSYVARVRWPASSGGPRVGTPWRSPASSRPTAMTTRSTPSWSTTQASVAAWWTVSKSFAWAEPTWSLFSLDRGPTMPTASSTGPPRCGLR